MYSLFNCDSRSDAQVSASLKHVRWSHRYIFTVSLLIIKFSNRMMVNSTVIDNQLHSDTTSFLRQGGNRQYPFLCLGKFTVGQTKRSLRDGQKFLKRRRKSLPKRKKDAEKHRLLCVNGARWNISDSGIQFT